MTEKQARKKKLKFSNPVFHKGLNLTVRRGTKWASEEFERVIVKRFCDIEPSEIKCEHDPKCRTKQGLLKELKRVYENFSEKEIVTLVYFVR